ncbi:MAG TPA: oleate hydratase [Roseiarcus sp.]|jgi:oleate hydratase
MKAHIVGGGFGGLAAAALLIKNAQVPGQDITIYEAEGELGGGYFLEGSPGSGYNLPGSVFDKEFRCGFELLSWIPTLADPKVSVRDQFFTFNDANPYNDQAHILDRSGAIVHGRHFGLTLADGLALARVSLTPESMLDGKRIEEFFSPRFFETEFWLLWSTIMGSLPPHSVIEFRRYMNRFVYLFPHLSTMAGVMRTPFNQNEAFVKPLVAWLRPQNVNFVTGAVVKDIGFEPAPARITVNKLDYVKNGGTSSVAVAPEDIVLVTTGSQAADRSTGTMTVAPGAPPNPGQSWALWSRLAQGRRDFGNPDKYFGAPRIGDSQWVTFTVTTTGGEFVERTTKLLGGVEPGCGGLQTLRDSGWVISFSIFHQPEVLGQPKGTHVWWGYGLHPERKGTFVQKSMDQCTGAEILEEVLRNLKFDDQIDTIMRSSICIPCNLPYVNNIWLQRSRGDRPPVVPEGSTNLGLIGQYVELQQDIAFTFEYSTRSAWEAIHQLLKRGPPPPPVYQGQIDPKGLLAALDVFLG